MAKRAATSAKLTDENLSKVILLLNHEKPITKKAACEILGITYNTSRLDTLIKDYQEKKAFEKEQREKKKYKPATEAEITFIIENYLSGDSVAELAKRIYRSDSFVKGILEKCGVPLRSQAFSYFRPGLLPDACVQENFTIGEKVFASRYESLATIKSIIPSGQGPVYAIYLEDERWQQFAYQPWWELGSLKHLTKFGVFK